MHIDSNRRVDNVRRRITVEVSLFHAPILQGDRSQSGGEEINCASEINETGHRKHSANDEHGIRRQAARRKRTVFGAPHERIVIAFDELV